MRGSMLWTGLLVACAPSGSRSGPNVLVILLDDMGPDAIGVYEAVADPPSTPTLDHLATTGMRFDRAYSAPICGPARASLLTGRHARRHGFGNNETFSNSSWALPPAERTIADVVHASERGPYTTAAFGKWHLAGQQWSGDPATHPRQLGFDRHATTFANIVQVRDGDDRRHGYFHWEDVIDGVVEHVDGYNPTVTVDRAIAAIADMPEPWMLYLPLHSAHDPWHVPPDGLQSSAGPDETDRHRQFRAMVEAADTEIGRLLDALAPVRDHTHVLVIGDNGTMEPAAAPDWPVQGHKATMAEGGIRVPLIVNGPAVAEPGSVHDGLTHIVDVLPTVADWVGVDLDGSTGGPMVDGQSLSPYLADPSRPGARSVLFGEWFGPNGSAEPSSFDRQVITDGTHKLFVKRIEGKETLHRVGRSPVDESPDLLRADGADLSLSAEDDAALARLRVALDATVAELSDGR